MPRKPPEPRVRIERTVHQICMADGTPYKAYATSCIWGFEGDSYDKTDGNSVTPLLTGEAYYKVLADKIAHARRTIYMLGWQINWDVHLTAGVRLYDALLNAVKVNPALKIYVLPWNDSAPVNTLDDEAVAVVRYINTQITGPQRAFAQLAPEHPNASAGADMMFSHHQKQVVIDNKIAFVGGMDVCWGRRDDATYPLNAAGRLGGDAYNGCVVPLQGVMVANGFVDANLVLMPDERTENGEDALDTSIVTAKAYLKAGKPQLPPSGKMIDIQRQPRMPWQDLHLQIEGPAVSDLASNFVLRWNVASNDAATLGFGRGPRLPLPSETKTYTAAGSCCVQMLRSASDVMVGLEAKTVAESDIARAHAEFGHNHIHHAMVRLIEHADHFIYIENQFFVSAFGVEGFGDKTEEDDVNTDAIKSAMPTWSGSHTGVAATRLTWGNAKAPPTNLICEALPLKLELAKAEVKQRFALAPSAIAAFNAYVGQCKVQNGTLTAIMREQRRLFIQWKLLRAANATAALESTASFTRASSFDQNDLHSANMEFGQELAAFNTWRAAQGDRFQPQTQAAGFDNEHLPEWKEISTWWTPSPMLTAEVTGFFDDYVHDSRAWFKLWPDGAGGSPDNEDEMHALLKSWVARRWAAEQARKRNPRARDGLTAEQGRAADLYAQSGKIPRMDNAGRETYALARAGYLRYRKVYAGGDTVLLSSVPGQDIAESQTA